MKLNHLFLTFITIIFYNIFRFIGNIYLTQSNWYQNMIYDNLHHYQLGIILIPISLLIFKKYPKVKNIILSIAMGMIIDESMYLMQFFKLQNFDHSHIQGVIFEWVIFIVYSVLILGHKNPPFSPPVL